MELEPANNFIDAKIYTVRGESVMLDSDLAAVYEVETGALNRAVKRNEDKFSPEFAFQLTENEWDALRCQIGISNEGRGGRRYLPWVFTEHGTVMLATVLNSQRAVKASIAIVKAFVRLRHLLTSNAALARRMDEFKWKEWRTPWGQEVLVTEKLALKVTSTGEVLAYPQGDSSAPASARMPEGGYFFDAIERPTEFDEDDPEPSDNTEEFILLSDEDLTHMQKHAKEANSHGRAVMAPLPGTAFGDVSNVPAMFLKNPKGIRDVSEWYISIAARQDFIHAVFSKQAEVAIENLKRIYAAVGDDAYDIAWVCGCDFGTQISTFCSKETFIELYQPYYRRVNDWIHQNTSWKTFKHSCGAIEPFIEPLIEAGFDILNPVQCSASGMNPQLLKNKYGDRVVFWGGSIDTQQTLPFGTPEQVRMEALERCKIFSRGGGFVFNSIHNVQALTPIANMVALLDAYKEFNSAGK